MRHTKFLSNTPSGSGEKNDFIGFAIFSYGGHLAFSIRLNFCHSDALQSGNASCEILEP